MVPETKLSRPRYEFAPAWRRHFLLDHTPKWVWAALYLLLVSAAIYLPRVNWAYDDPFITYRYAHNLANGFGFVYNPGERVLSTTSPLFALILAGVSSLGGDIPKAANLIGALSIAAGGLILFDLGNTLTAPRVGWLALILYPTVPLLHTTIGSETPLYIALCLACFAAYLRFSYTWLALFAALAALARPDGLLVVGLLTVHFFLTRRRTGFPWKPALLFGALLLGWAVFASLYFGSPIPATLATRQHQGLMAISQPFSQGLIQLAKSKADSALGLIQAGLALIGVIYLACCARQWALFLAWQLVYLLAYSALGVTTYFWYYAPLVPGFVVLIALGVSGIGAGIDKTPDRFPKAPPQLRAALNIGLSLAVLVIAALQIHASIIAGRQLDPRQAIYRDLGLWLKQHTPPGATIGALEVGIIGYYAERPIFDFAGLIQPEVARFLSRNTSYMNAAEYVIQRYKPDILVLNSASYPDIASADLLSNCRRVQRFSGSSYGYGSDIEIFDCRTP